MAVLVRYEKACVAEMSKSLSPYACAAKSFFSAKTNAKKIDPRQPEMFIKPVENQ